MYTCIIFYLKYGSLHNQNPWSSGYYIHLQTWRSCVRIPASPFSIFFPQKQDKRWGNLWQWEGVRIIRVELEIINFKAMPQNSLSFKSFKLVSWSAGLCFDWFKVEKYSNSNFFNLISYLNFVFAKKICALLL